MYSKWGLELSNQPSVDLLNDKSAVGILLLALRDKKIYASDLRKLGGSFERLKRTANNLIDGNLMSMKTIERPYLTYIYSLTEKGEKVANKLLEIDSIIKNNASS